MSLPKFGISERLVAFSFVIFFYFLVSLDEIVETLTHEFLTAWILNVMLVKNIMWEL